MKTYQELIALPTFKERYDYLKTPRRIGDETFGFERWLNQVLYKSSEWRRTRENIIIRDNGCDLGIIDRPITGKIIVHHMNPISIEDIRNRNLDLILNPDYLISCSHNTHEAIHYSSESILSPDSFNERKPGDTILWR